MRALIMAMFASLLAACTPNLATFDYLTPKDRGARQVVTGASYGADARQRLDVYAPNGARDAPVIVVFYGGSWANGARGEYRFAGAAFAARGFVTVIPDYRLVPDVHFPAFVEDGAMALKWVTDHISEYGGDPSRIVLIGHSSGAYIGAMLTLDQHYVRAAGVDPASIRGFGGIAGPYDFAPFRVKASIDAFGQSSDPAATQPINFARRDAPPMLLLHGAKDQLVEPRNMFSLAERMRAQGAAAVEAKLYPGIGHINIMLALSKPLRGKAPVLNDLTSFAARVTKRGPVR